MLYFSKLRIYSIALLTLFFVFLSSTNFFNKISFFDKNINLGLDLQGGSYLLLEVDNKPVILQKLQSKLSTLRIFLKEKNFNFNNLQIIDDNFISFNIDVENIDELKNVLQDKENDLNPYYPQFKSHELEVKVDESNFRLNFSKYGLINIKNSSLDQAIEIVRRRIDEIGTNEPNILKRGNNRILVELPGLDDPMRIKSLLGKTANLTFRFVTQNTEETFGSEILLFEDDSEEVNVSKRIILSGDNLLDAQPRMDNQTNETVVTFNLDRVGSKKFAKATTSGVGKRLAIVLDGKVVSAPVIRSSIVGGSGQISGNFTFQSATDLALLLRSGALPAPLNIIEERTVGPDLGQDSINAGVIALLLGFFLVIIFMFFKYKIFGLIANITLIINFD